MQGGGLYILSSINILFKLLLQNYLPERTCPGKFEKLSWNCPGNVLKLYFAESVRTLERVWLPTEDGEGRGIAQAVGDCGDML